jgi:TRAP-type C4-dicarboxylate transport system permease large subunit
VLTLPIVIPIMEALHFDLIWWGVIMVIVLEMGLISPPVGINVFVVKGLVPDVPMGQIFRGILPFWVAMLVCICASRSSSSFPRSP